MPTRLLIFMLFSGRLLLSGEPPPKMPPAGVNGWPGKPYDKVVGYRFENTDHLSFIQDGELRIAKLDQQKRKETALSSGNVKTLLTASFEAEKPQGGALCYEPHHIFVFYAKTEPVGAIEICFQCLGAKCWPENKAIWWHTDFANISKLTSALGLGGFPANATKPAAPSSTNQLLDKLR
jgi:hypothetical protein